MPYVITAIIYLALCAIIAILGSNRKFGFWGYFFASLALTPIIGFFLLVASDPKKTKSNS